MIFENAKSLLAGDDLGSLALDAVYQVPVQGVSVVNGTLQLDYVVVGRRSGKPAGALAPLDGRLSYGKRIEITDKVGVSGPCLQHLCALSGEGDDFSDTGSAVQSPTRRGRIKMARAAFNIGDKAVLKNQSQVKALVHIGTGKVDDLAEDLLDFGFIHLNDTVNEMHAPIQHHAAAITLFAAPSEGAVRTAAADSVFPS